MTICCSPKCTGCTPFGTAALRISVNQPTFRDHWSGMGRANEHLVRSLLLALLGLSLLAARAAAVDKDLDGTYLSLGPSFGGHFHRGEGEALFGGELTLFRFTGATWTGAIADGRLVAGESLSGLFSLGVEAGHGPYGVNAAPVLVLAPHCPCLASQFSVSASLLFAHAYARAGWGPSYGSFGEIALQFKLPTKLRGEGARERQRE